MSNFMVFFVGLFITFSAHATIDSEGKVLIPYTPAQAANDLEFLANNWNEPWTNTQMYCFAPYLYMDYVSSSALPQYEFMMKPFHIPTYPQEGTVQINEFADGIIQIKTDWDKFEKYVYLDPKDWNTVVHLPEFTVDVSGYDQTTKVGRLKALIMAKLAVISLHYNLGQYGQLFRLKLDIIGLPQDQSEFIKPGFSRVLAQTAFPYSGPSPVAQNFYDELIARDFCDGVYKKAKSFE